jgi:hypothetical protein
MVIQQRMEDPRPAAEPAEHRALAHAGSLGQPVHGELVRSLLG